MTLDGTNLNAPNRTTLRQVAEVTGKLLFIAGAVASSAAECKALAPPSEFNTPPPAVVPAGTNFYTSPMRLGDKPCGTTTVEIPNVSPATTETEGGGGSAVVNNGYSHTVIIGSLNPDHSCGSGDANGIVWRQSEVIMLPGAGLPG